jgi:hypothetical protein
VPIGAIDSSYDTQARFLAAVSSLSDEEALRIGKALCPCDHAVQNFTLTWHGKFFGRRDLLDRALRRAGAAALMEAGDGVQ